METTYFSISSKSTFNKALRHFFKVNDFVEDVESNVNLADIINEEIDSDEIVQDQVLPIIGSVLRDKFNYSYRSVNIPKTVTDFTLISEETAKWTALDIVLVYYAPSGNSVIINPKTTEHFERARELSCDQLLGPEPGEDPNQC